MIVLNPHLRKEARVIPEAGRDLRRQEQQTYFDLLLCARLLSLAIVLYCARTADARIPQDPYADLAKEVTIRRTTHGVPHVTAPTLKAVAFGFGYCQAEDHSESIMYNYLAANGQLAETFGGKDNLERDFRSRRFKVRERAVNTYHHLDEDFRSMLEGFAAGFNYFIKKHPAGLPPWIRPVTGHDVAAHGMAGVMRFAFDRGGVIERFQAGNQRKLAWVPEGHATDMFGSNMWALAPSRTKAGHAILLGNPHQPWSREATYYEAHLIVPGIMNFHGSTFIGRPVLTSGFNEYLGWSHTVNYPDLEEIYALELDPSKEDHFLFDGDSIPLQKQEVTVRWRDGRILRNETRTYWHSPLGPVIDRDAKNAYVLRSAIYDEYRAYVQWLRMSLARSYEEFRAALELQAVPMFNVCYADREGNIEYVWNGTIPVLPHGPRFAEAVPASQSSEIWTRFHSLAELPQLFNPPGGYVQNCNDPFHYTNLRVPMDPSAFPSYFSPRRLGLRTQHCLELIGGDQKLSLEEVRDLKFSEKMLLADRMKEDLMAAVTMEKPTGATAEAIEILKKWDNSVSANSVGSVLFETWWRHYALQGKRNLGAPIEADSYAIPWTADEPMKTPRELGNKLRAVSALQTAIDEVQRDHGRLDVAWGEVHRLRRGDKDLPAGGGSGFLGCFRVLSFADAQNHQQVIDGGDGWIFAVEFSDPPKAFSVLAYGQSSNPHSPYFSDQAELFATNQMKPVPFTDEQIQAQTLHQYRPGEEKSRR